MFKYFRKIDYLLSTKEDSKKSALADAALAHIEENKIYFDQFLVNCSYIIKSAIGDEFIIKGEKRSFNYNGDFIKEYFMELKEVRRIKLEEVKDANFTEFLKKLKK